MPGKSYLGGNYDKSSDNDEHGTGPAGRKRIEYSTVPAILTWIRIAVFLPECYFTP